MGQNFHTPYTSATRFVASEMTVPLAEIDKAITYIRNSFFHCDGAVAYDKATGVLSWSGTLRLIFTTAAGVLVENSVAAGSVTLTDGQAATVDASETNGATMTVTARTMTTAATSVVASTVRFVLGYRNTASDEFYPCWLQMPTTGSSTPAATTRDVSVTGTVAEGDILSIATGGGYVLADASALATLQNVVLVTTGGTGTATVTDAGTQAGFTGLTAGGAMYVSETAGDLTQTAPTTVGAYVKCVGWALSTTEIIFRPDTVAVEV